MVHASRLVRFSPEWNGRDRYVSSRPAARDALEQADGVHAGRDPPIGHRSRQSIGDEGTDGDAIRTGEGEVGAERTLVALPAGVRQSPVQVYGQLGESLRAGDDPDPQGAR